MKKILLALAIILAPLSAKASYLFPTNQWWQYPASGAATINVDGISLYGNTASQYLELSSTNGAILAYNSGNLIDANSQLLAFLAAGAWHLYIDTNGVAVNNGYAGPGSGIGLLVGSGSEQFSGNLNMTGNAVTNVLNPVGVQDAATKNYVDGLIPSGVSKGAVTFVNALTTPVTQFLSGFSSTSAFTFGEKGTAFASSFGWISPGASTIVFNGTFAGAATVSFIGIK